jgi:deazaflavin-dependent oxidoreductase (nitroreductase family)
LLVGLPIITLTTTGARSGLRRSVPLVGIPDGDKIILIASNWGQKRHPAWYYNLLANPGVRVSHDSTARDYIAREAKGEEYAYYWNKAVSANAGYSAYRQRTGGREIPVIVLTPQQANP